MTFELDVDLVEDKGPACKGLFFRASVSSYKKKDGSYETKHTLRFLKRKSCKGCEQCYGTLEYLDENVSCFSEEALFTDLIPGKIYTPVWVNMGRGFEDTYDEYEVQWEEVKKEDKQ